MGEVGSHRRGPLYGLLIAALVGILYAPSFGRGFVSEDFLILRRLFEARQAGELPATAWANATGPWLQITLVSFFRPLSSFFLQLEESLFGTTSGAYFVVHLGIHLLNSWLVFRLARRIWRPGQGNHETAAPWIVATLFSVYPLHPNTVVFVASFATLLCGTFVLAGLCFYLQDRFAAAALCLACALACYEQAAVMPVLFAASDLCLRPRNGLWRRTLLRWTPSFVVLGAYLGIRRLLLGHSIGGYRSFHDRLSDPVALIGSLADNLGRMIYPIFAPSSVHLVGALGAVLLTLLAGWARCRSGPEVLPWVGSGLYGGCLLVVCQAPFAFVGVVPGNGRYWYLSSVGLALLLTSGLHLLARAGDGAAKPRSRYHLVFRTGAVAWIVLYGSLLWSSSRLHAEAGSEAARLRQATGAFHEGSVFVAGAPAFLTHDGVNTAQIFHWGLADSTMPPFMTDGADLYPLPALEDDAFLPLVGRTTTLLRWSSGGFQKIQPSPNRRFDVPDRREELAATCDNPRLVLIAKGNSSVRSYSEPPSPDDDWIRSMQTLYPKAPIYWWIECREAAKRGSGRLVAVSGLKRLDPPGARTDKAPSLRPLPGVE